MDSAFSIGLTLFLVNRATAFVGMLVANQHQIHLVVVEQVVHLELEELRNNPVTILFQLSGVLKMMSWSRSESCRVEKYLLVRKLSNKNET